MSTEASKQFMTALKRPKQVKSRNRTAGAMAFAILPADNERWSIGALDHSCGGDSNHSTMPAIPVENDAARVDELRFCQTLFERLYDLLFALLAIGIQLIQSRG